VQGLSIGPFRVLRKLGVGGMGEVFLAEDERLGRRVALKCPSEHWLELPDARARLQREARAAAQLNDPRIAAVYDVLEVDDRPYIIMEYVDGEPLSSLVTHGPVPVERAIEIGVQLAEALAVAHASGVIHRDVKPGNVMLTSDGRLKVLDFGLARTNDPSAGALTAPGQVLGTPGYISPEQLLGRPADARSDVFGAGAILYELLTGRPPTADIDPKKRGLSALLEPIPDISLVNPSIPREVCAVVMKALAREPGDRFQSATELAGALSGAATALHERPTRLITSIPRHPWNSRWVRMAAIGFLVAALGVPLVRWWRGSPHSGTPIVVHGLPVIAVLPLTNLSSDAMLNYIGAGLADTISTKLAGVSAISVVSRAEIRDAMDRTPEVSKVCRSLGVSYAVTGGVQQSGDRLQITINLLSPDGRTIVHGGIYQDSTQNLFELQRRIAEDLTSKIVGTVSATDRAQLARTSTSTSVDAISAYWRGRALMDKAGPDPIDPAIAAFGDCIRYDAGFALGYAGLGGAYWRKYEQTKDPQWAAKAIDAAERGRQIAPEQAEVRIALATVYKGSGRTQDAIAELRKVLDLQPSNYDAHITLGDIQSDGGHLQEAETEYTAAQQIRPDYWWTYRQLGLLQMASRRFDEAIKSFEKITELQPDSPFGYQLLGTVHGTMFDLDAATRDYENAMAHGGSFGTYSSLGTVYYLQGRFADAVQSYRHAIELRPKSGKTYWNLGDAYRHLRRSGDAAEAYRQAVTLLDADLRVNPKNAPARGIRATCLARLGRLDDAVVESEKAVTVAPQNQDVQYHRAVVLMLSGRLDEAVTALRQAVADGYPVELLRRDIDLVPLKQASGFQALLATDNALSRRSR
jgi:tetratricopeptide (TPR) repeat protein/TolB-like protein/predicted Ser/Thr protein kinase